MTKNNDDLLLNSEEKSGSVWSDLRVMKTIDRMQKDINSLKAAQKRLQILLLISVLLIGSTTVALAGVFAFTYRQIPNLEQPQE